MKKSKRPKQGEGWSAMRFSSTWSQHRYGPKAPITLAGPQPGQRLLSKGKREHIVAKIVVHLEDFRQTPFEHEGSMRAGIRSGFCLTGASWQASDTEAQLLVAEGLRRIGAKRPTWLEGQREYLTPSECCLQCGTDIPEDLFQVTRAYPRGFCSDVCARSYRERKALRWDGEQAAIYGATKAVIARATVEPRNCQQCGRLYRAAERRDHTRFCSKSCAAAARVVILERDCANCGTSFRPKTTTKAGRFCSHACYSEHKQRLDLTTSCLCCGRRFRGIALYCSSLCRKVHHKVKKGWKPKRSSPVVFDHFVTKPINEIPRRMSPRNFDWMILELGLKITGETSFSAGKMQSPMPAS